MGVNMFNKRIFNFSIFCLLSIFLYASAYAEVSAGTGKVKFNSVLQTWAADDTTQSPNFNFRLRRAELRFSGSVAENTEWFVMADPAKALPLATITGAAGTGVGVKGVADNSDAKILQDLGISHKILPELELTVGQFKTLTSAEGLDGAGDLWFAERSLPGRYYGDEREPGAKVVYSGDRWKLGAMASNGNGTNSNTTDDRKDVSTRFDVSPMDNVDLGAFIFARNARLSDVGVYGLNGRFGFGDLALRFEGMLENRSGKSYHGYVVEGAYSVNENWQPALRYDARKDIAGTDEFTGSGITAGLNYHVSKHNSKVQLNYSYLKNASGGGGTAALLNKTGGSLLVLAFQAKI